MRASEGIIDFERLERQLPALRAAFAGGDPIRHVVVDDFLVEETARRATRAFPSPQEMEIAFAGLPEVKNAEQRLERLDPIFAVIFGELGSPRFLDWLGALTEIPGLRPDPQLHGGGLHQGADGSFLDVHADFNVHPQLGLYRRLNVLVYLNEVWEPRWQGYLELWSRDMQACRQYLEPRFNRLVVMETHDHAYHGYKELRLPRGVTRKSLAAYYYSERRSEAQSDEEHNTLFRLRPEQRTAAGVRLFVRRLGSLAPAPLRGILRCGRRLLRLD